MPTEFELNRGETRSFYCPNKLWNKVKKQNKDCYSISVFIQMAIKEKLKKIIRDEDLDN